jgi:hypothetical protein
MKKIFLILVSIFGLVGCVGGNYGVLSYDRQLNNSFATYQVLAGHNYYLTGGNSAPAAILAIHKDYEIDNSSNLWVLVPDVSTSLMKKWIDNTSGDANFWEGVTFQAFYILNPEGKRIGAFYSGKKTPVEFLEEHRVKVFPPVLQPMPMFRRR